MCPGEGHHLAECHPFPAEVLLKLLCIQSRKGEVAPDVGFEGDLTVPPPAGDGVTDVAAAGDVGAVTSREGDDVRAGDGLRAFTFEPRFRGVDDIVAT